MQDVGLLVGDATKQSTIDDLVKSTHVVIAAAGPYSKMGAPVVDACVRMHSHYVDLTGELLGPWVDSSLLSLLCIPA